MAPPQDEQSEVLAANRAFYEAHEQRSIDAMSAVWQTDDGVTCTHPGWPTLHGWDAVRESWASIFRGPGRNQFILTNERVTVTGDAAWVTVDENMVDRGSTGTIAATNVFVRNSRGWLMVVHHGSPVMAR